ANAQEAIPWRGERGITESVRDIMAREHAQGARSPQASRIPPRGRIPGKLTDKPGSSTAPESQIPEFAESTIAGGNVSAAITLDTPLVFNAQTSGMNFLGPVYANSGFLPPDSMGAVGPSQIVVGVNGWIRTYDKKDGTADFALNTTMDSFFNSVRNSSTTSDPRVVFDRLSQRWFVSMINTSTPNRILLAVSSGATITAEGSFTF